MLLVCIVKIILVFHLPKIVERKQRKCTNIITDNISILFYGFVNEIFSPKTLKCTATYLERHKAYQLMFSVLFYILMLPLLSRILLSIWMRFLSPKEFTGLSSQICTYRDCSFFLFFSGIISYQLFGIIKVKSLPFTIVKWLASPAFGNRNRY